MSGAFGEAMAARFGGSGFSNDVFKLLDGGAAAERLAKVYLVLAEKAETKLAIGSKAESVALVAEVFGDGGDKADSALSAREAVIFGGAAAFIYFERFQFTQRGESFSHFTDGKKMGYANVLAVDRHVLDEAHVPTVIDGLAGEIEEFIVINTSHDDHIDFHGS
jgi:hypothetical protein